MCYLITVALGPKGDLARVKRVAEDLKYPLYVATDHPGLGVFPHGATLLRCDHHCACDSAVGKGVIENEYDQPELEVWRRILLAGKGDWVGLIRSWSDEESLPHETRELASRDLLTPEVLLHHPERVLLQLPPDTP